MKEMKLNKVCWDLKCVTLGHVNILILFIFIQSILKVSGQDGTYNAKKYYSNITSTFPNKVIQFDTVSITFIDSLKSALKFTDSLNSALTSNKYEKKVKDSLIYYEDSQNGDWWAVYKVNKSIWIKIPLPYDLTESGILINIDKKGTPELIIKGDYREYGNGGGGESQSGWLIFNIEKSPTLILSIINYCINESPGRQDDNHIGEGAFKEEWERKIKIEKGGITINTQPKKRIESDLCPFDNTPSGHYNLVNGQFVKEN